VTERRSRKCRRGKEREDKKEGSKEIE
jgi:hypothetical protein